MRDIKFLVSLGLILLLASGAEAQEQPLLTQKRSAPRITGRLVGTDGTRQLILEYRTGSGRGTFIGNIHSTCMIPAKSTTAETTTLDLAKIPKGSDVTF